MSNRQRLLIREIEESCGVPKEDRTFSRYKVEKIAASEGYVQGKVAVSKFVQPSGQSRTRIRAQGVVEILALLFRNIYAYVGSVIVS